MSIGELSSPRFLGVTLVCAAIAFVMSMLSRGYAVAATVPLIFLLAVVCVMILASRLASLAVAIVASFIFAACLFEPYGSLAIRSWVDRIDLLSFGLAAIGMVHFSPRHESLTKSAPLLSSFESSATVRRPDVLEAWIAVVGYCFSFMALVTLLLYMWN